MKLVMLIELIESPLSCCLLACLSGHERCLGIIELYIPLTNSWCLSDDDTNILKELRYMPGLDMSH